MIFRAGRQLVAASGLDCVVVEVVPSFTAVLGIRDSWPDETKTERASWPVADKKLTINEKSMCLVAKSRPDLCSSISLSRGYLPRPMGPAGSRLTELQTETTGTALSVILFLQGRRNMFCGSAAGVWRGCSGGCHRNRPDRFAAVNHQNGFPGKSASELGYIILGIVADNQSRFQ